ncbi:MAG: hypothetical protein GXP31_09695 [Kiritimatiellaeota bacterium]|nr:hypothetical protein [Kiritimatiellota bacterium]
MLPFNQAPAFRQRCKRISGQADPAFGRRVGVSRGPRSERTGRPTGVVRATVAMTFAWRLSVGVSAAVPGNGLLFHAGFEGTIRAATARGNGAPRKRPDAPVYVRGVRGQALRLTKAAVHYSRNRNLALGRGTIAFWMRPVDWAPEKKTAGYEWTFSVCGVGAGGDRIQFFKMPTPMLMFFMGTEGHVKQLTWRIRKWPRGSWRLIVLTWNARGMKLYLDGECAARTTIAAENIAVDPGPLIRLQSGATTDYDEFRIYERALLDTEILAIYKAERPANPAPSRRRSTKSGSPVTRIPRLMRAPPVIDGVAAPGEWDDATLVTGFLLIPELELARRWTRVNLCYDANALYVRLVTPVSTLPDIPVAPRDDMDLWKMPSAELLFTPGTDADMPVHQLVFNTAGARFDQRGGDKAWDPEWECRSSVTAGVWTAEVRVPFAGIGCVPPRTGQAWRLNIGRNLLAPKKFSNPVFALAYADTTAFWRVVFGRPGESVQLVTSVDAASRRLGVKGSVGPELPDEARLVLAVKRLPMEARQRRTMGDFDGLAVPLLKSVSLTVGKLRSGMSPVITLPGPGRYVARTQLTPDATSTVYRQVVHFVVRERFTAELAFRSRERTMLVNWELTGPVGESAMIRAEVEAGGLAAIRPKGLLLSAAERVGEATAGTLRFDLSRLTQLDYTVAVTLDDDGKTERRLLPMKCFYNADWIGFERRLAREHRVPGPWVPLRAGESEVTTLTQHYRFGPRGMPLSMRAGGREILAAPIRLEMATATSRFAPGKGIAWGERHADTAVFELSFQASDADARLKVRTEFDGMSRYDLTIRPLNNNTRMTRLVLEIPIRPDVARFKYPVRGPYQAWDVLDLDADVGPVYADAFLPHIWVGDDDRGIAWFAESDEFYEPEDRDKVIELVRDKEAVVLRVNMITFPRRLTVPTTFTFGLQATPTRPMPVPNWTAYRFASSISSSTYHVTTGYTTGAEYHVTLGVPFPVQDLDRARRFVKSVHSRPGRSAVVYATSNGMGDGGAEFRFFEQEWKNPSVCDTWSFASRGQYHWGTCPTVETLRDYFLWRTAQAIDELGIDGLYYDYATVFPADNPDAGCGYERDGKRFPTWPIFADRAMRKRIYELFMTKRGKAVFVYHNYSRMMTPIASFATLHLDGESYQRRTGVIGARITTDYTKLLTNSRIRAMFGTQFGTVPYFLAKLAGRREDYGTPWLKKATRTLAAMMLPHGVPIWGFYCDIPELNRYTAVQDRFGIAAARFVPYYRIRDEIGLVPAPAPGKVLVSYWARPGKALVVVGNLTDTVFSGALRIDPGRLLGVKAGRVTATDPSSGANLEVRSAGVAVDVPAKDYRFLEVAPEAATR